jgi:hypothetical protein
MAATLLERVRTLCLALPKTFDPPGRSGAPRFHAQTSTDWKEVAELVATVRADGI